MIKIARDITIMIFKKNSSTNLSRYVDNRIFPLIR